jgi:hypothetical protein
MYKIYPTLLNSFAIYLNRTTDREGELIVDFQEMINRINRVKKPTTEAQQRGINFEKAITTGEGEEDFPEEIIEKGRAILPQKFKTQFYVESRYKNVSLYGFVDLISGNRAYDIKTTRNYDGTRYALNHQNLYLLGLQKWGIKSLDYVITDMNDVYVESYHIDTYDFTPLYEQIDLFVEFLETNKRLIRDKKIIDRKTDTNQLSLF